MTTGTVSSSTDAATSSTGAASSSEGSSGGDELGSSSSAADTTSSDTTGGDDSSSEGASSTGEVPEDCVGIEPIELLDPSVTPIDAASWVPGGSVSVDVTMHNTGPDFLDYPSIIVESDDPLVTSAAPGNQLFAILADQSVELGVVFDADRAVAPGTDVVFTIRMAVLDVPCPNGDTVQVQATVE